MPRKVKSDGEPTQQRKTSQKRAMGLKGPSGARSNRAGAPVDGGKWAGEGRKTVEHSKGPKVARVGEHGRGAKTRTTMRSDKKNHPNHG